MEGLPIQKVWQQNGKHRTIHKYMKANAEEKQTPSSLVKAM